MAKDGKKVAIGVGAAAIVVGTILIATKAKAKPPPQPEPGLATRYGVVSDAVQALQDVSVILWDAPGVEQLGFTQTDAKGSYSIKNILPGDYMVQFVKEGYEIAIR